MVEHQVLMTTRCMHAISKLKGFKIASLNIYINSLLKHMDSLRVLLSNSSILDILTINETKIDACEKSKN